MNVGKDVHTETACHHLQQCLNISFERTHSQLLGECVSRCVDALVKLGAHRTAVFQDTALPLDLQKRRRTIVLVNVNPCERQAWVC